ncbi:MAG: GntR family transcriptional regulator [Eubacteriales bacterium]|nr:GntR family transcriptional regulator [Eubacteriales bacterium]
MVKDTKPLTSKVYDYVYGNIIDGKITSNDILTEGALVSELQVSKSPVREALILLCQENVLQAIPRMGYRVVQITSAQVTLLIEARYALEPFLLEKAWSGIGEVQIAQLQHHQEASKRDELVNTSIQDNWRRNIEFHMLLGSFAGNDYLLDALHRVLKTCARAANQYFLNVRGIPQGDDDIHDQIFAAIVGRDFDKALTALKEDLRQII